MDIDIIIFKNNYRNKSLTYTNDNQPWLLVGSLMKYLTRLTNGQQNKVTQPGKIHPINRRIDIGYLGFLCTWYNKRENNSAISERLDKALANYKMVKHLAHFYIEKFTNLSSPIVHLFA